MTSTWRTWSWQNRYVRWASSTLGQTGGLTYDRVLWHPKDALTVPLKVYNVGPDSTMWLIQCIMLVIFSVSSFSWNIILCFYSVRNHGSRYSGSNMAWVKVLIHVLYKGWSVWRRWWWWHMVWSVCSECSISCRINCLPLFNGEMLAQEWCWYMHKSYLITSFSICCGIHILFSIPYHLRSRSGRDGGRRERGRAYLLLGEEWA
jgi:hypothetical protein